MGKLTAFTVKAATQPGRYQDGDGLMLIVKSAKSRSWQVRVQVDGKRRDFGLGSASLVSLAAARDKPEAIRKLYKDGVDPVGQEACRQTGSTGNSNIQEWPAAGLVDTKIRCLSDWRK